MCHGSRYMKDATKYKPNVADIAIMIMPPESPEPLKKLPKNFAGSSVLNEAPAIPLTAKYMDKTMIYALITPNTTNDIMYVIREPFGLLPSARINCTSTNAM